MAKRRSSLPREIAAELQERAREGIGLDLDYKTVTSHGVCTAAEARKADPSLDMVSFAQRVVSFLNTHNASQLRVFTDRERNHPGTLVLAWTGGPAAARVAEQFAVSRGTDGTPRIPAWIALHPDHERDFDLRWRPAL